MFIPKWRIERMERDIDRLRVRLDEVERNGRMYLSPYGDAIPLKKIISAVVDHCGLELEHQYPVEASVKVTKKGKK